MAGFVLLAALTGCLPVAAPAADAAAANAQQARRAIVFCHRHAHGWLSAADPVTGLLPRNVQKVDQALWNAWDCAADNYPFIVLTALITDQFHLRQAAEFILQQEQRLTNREGCLPDTYCFRRQAFHSSEPSAQRMLFGAAEYAKDGLLPITEWLGPGPWLDRMAGLLEEVLARPGVDSPAGPLPSTDAEINGDLLEAACRLFWIRRDPRLRELVWRLGDYYLLEDRLLNAESLRLQDHGSEVIGGLSEAYLLAAHEDPDRRRRWMPRLHALLDRILAVGANADGMLYNVVNLRAGQVTAASLADTWGYVYNAFLTVAMLDDRPDYRAAVEKVLRALPKYRGFEWEQQGIDGVADAVEGAINLLNRVPVAEGFQWVDGEMERIFAAQGEDGITEGWYGDGNSARTALMYALWKSQGVSASPWRQDLRLGAAREDDGSLVVFVSPGWAWTGRLRFDKARHRENLRMPLDYPRINRFPEWFTVEPAASYSLQRGDQEPQRVEGETLLQGLPLELEAGQTAVLRIRRLDVSPAATQTAPALATSAAQEAPATRPVPARLRVMRYRPGSPEEAVAWQDNVRRNLIALLRIDDLMASPPPLNPQDIGERRQGGVLLREVEVDSVPGHRIRLLVGLPGALAAGVRTCPGIVCLHGHGGTPAMLFEEGTPYKAMAAVLVERGAVVIAPEVGRHETRAPGRTLMGERLWDTMRAVDLLLTMPQVDPARIGCAGLSLGGEMAMWLGATDLRVRATCSSGFLTRMDQMEQGHCMCWKFEGLRELVDFADIYSLIAPRPLQCQNGLAEPPNMFPVPIAREAMAEIKQIYADLGKPGMAGLAVHPGGHEMDIPAMLAFFEAHLGLSRAPSP